MTLPAEILLCGCYWCFMKEMESLTKISDSASFPRGWIYFQDQIATNETNFQVFRYFINNIGKRSWNSSETMLLINSFYPLYIKNNVKLKCLSHWWILDIISKEGIEKCRDIYLGKTLSQRLKWLSQAPKCRKLIRCTDALQSDGGHAELKVIAKKIVELFANSGIRVVAFDMDQCIVAQHSRF